MAGMSVPWLGCVGSAALSWVAGLSLALSLPWLGCVGSAGLSYLAVFGSWFAWLGWFDFAWPAWLGWPGLAF